jgi:hypothetical protein
VRGVAQDLVIGMQLHQGKMVRLMCSNSLGSTGVQGVSGSSTAPQGQHQQPPQQSTQQQQSQQQGDQPAAAAAAGAAAVKVFTVSTKDIATVRMLLQLFLTGWPVESPLKVYTGLCEPGFAKGLPKNQAQQYALLQQGYLLVKAVSELNGLTLQQAADVVEVWRGHTDAVISADGSGSVAAAPAAGTQLPSLLPAATNTNNRWTMNRLCQAARGLDCVQAQKDGKRSAAGREGGKAAKKQKATHADS